MVNDLNFFEYGGKFYSIELIAEGGFSYIYLLVENQEKVVLKALKPELLFTKKLGTWFKEKFKQEAGLYQRLNHPYLIKSKSGIIEVEVPDKQGKSFKSIGMLLEYLPHNLSRFIKKQQGEREIKEILQLMIKILDVIGYLHEEKILHRDIKPSNIYFPDSSIQNPKLADLGIAKVLEAPSHTVWWLWPGEGAKQQMVVEAELGGQEGALLTYFAGCDLYIAPEVRRLIDVMDPDKLKQFGADKALAAVQADKSCGFHSPAMDVFGVGAILYLLLTGINLVEVEKRDKDTLYHYRFRIEALGDNVSYSLEQILRRAVNPDFTF